MSDIVARLREGAAGCMTDAADEIERLTAELAAERNASAAWRENYDIALSKAGKAVRERDELRDKLTYTQMAEHAALEDREVARAERDALRAELAAERERAHRAAMELKRHMPISKYNGLGIEEWKAQADALRALLREAREYVDDDAHPLSIVAGLLARIDAALKDDDSDA